jgi:hypothetical protein
MSQPMPDFMRSPYFNIDEFKMEDDAPEDLKKAFDDWLKEGKTAADAGIGL